MNVFRIGWQSKKWGCQLLVVLQIIFQITLPFVTYLLPARAIAQSQTSTTSPVSADNENITVPGSATLSSAASALSDNGSAGMASMATSAATGYASSSAQAWLAQFGTARVQLNVDENGNWDNSSFDFLAPLYDNKKSVLFTQLGFRAPDGRKTGNFGAGVRTFNTPNWMFGMNVFFDDDFTGDNRRVGVGAEAWTNYLKLSANTYVGTTDWHSSRDFDDYNEKPADGFDIRAEGYLPAYPQLGAKIMYEQYYGDNVALFDTDHLQSNPSATTVGVNYTPVPLVTAGVDYKVGQDSMDETLFELNFRYVPGESLQSQLSPSQVAFQRSLAGSRYDLVERNNEIVLQYKKKDEQTVVSNLMLTPLVDKRPADGLARDIVVVRATTSSGDAVKNAAIIWSVTGNGQLGSTTGVTDANGYAKVSIKDTTVEQVQVTATSGQASGQTYSSFVQQSVNSLNLKITQDDSAADGKHENVGEVTAKDAKGNVLSGVAIKWQLSDDTAKITDKDATTDSNGKATVHFTDSQPETVKLTASSDGVTESKDSSFAALTAKTIDVTMQTDNALSDGRSTDIAQAKVYDSAGNVMSGASVTWTLDTGSATATSSLTATTDANGVATLSLTDSKEESVTLTAKSGDAIGQGTATFTAVPVNKVAVSMTTNNATADNSKTNTAKALITDKNGSPMANEALTWSFGNGSAKAVGSLDATTDANGEATLSMTDSVAENVEVIASAGGQTGSATAVFTAIPVDKIVVSMTKNNAAADDKTENVAQVVLTDASGNVMPDVDVTWSLGSSTAKITTSEVKTDTNGVATVNFTDSVAENVTVTANVEGNKSGETTSVFTAVLPDSIVMSTVTDNVTADNSSADEVQAKVTDANGNAMSGVTVNWTLSSTSAKATSATTATTDANGVVTLSLTDSVVENVDVTATAEGGLSGNTTVHFSGVDIGPVTVYYPTAKSENSYLNIDAVTGGLKIVVQPWPGMVAGDKVSVHFVVTGEFDAELSDLSSLPDYTSEVHTVEASEVGSNITFVVPQDVVLGLQPSVTVPEPSLTGTATGTVVHSAPDETITSEPVSRYLDTK